MPLDTPQSKYSDFSAGAFLKIPGVGIGMKTFYNGVDVFAIFAQEPGTGFHRGQGVQVGPYKEAKFVPESIVAAAMLQTKTASA